MRRKKKIYSVDCETNPFSGEGEIVPFIWGIWDGEIYKQFYDTEKFVECLSMCDGIAYAHNGGKFDWLFLSDYIDGDSDMTIIGGRLAKARIGLCEIRDSYNILPVPLSAYRKDDMDYSIMVESERNKPHNKKLIEDYLKMDCVYLLEFVMSFINEYGTGLTIAGSAMRVWEKMSGGREDRLGSDFYDTFSPFYMGGRVECFKSGVFDHDFEVIDINSAYPYAMVHDMPHGSGYVEGETLDGLSDYEISMSMVEVVAVSRGCLGFRGEKGTVKYYNDTVERHYFTTGWEILAGLRTGTLDIARVCSVKTFLEPINFKGYVDTFFSKKVECTVSGDDAGRLIAKLFLNALYGKYASNGRKYEEFRISEYDSLGENEEKGFLFRGEMGRRCVVGKKLEGNKLEKTFFNVVTAGAITGFVRAYLWEALCKVQGKMYCDTDSIACVSSEGLELHPTDLGAWDLEAECIKGGIGGKKMYVFEKKAGTYKKEKNRYKTACKGVRLTPAELFRVCSGEEVVYNSLAPSMSIKGADRYISRRVNKTVDI